VLEIYRGLTKESRILLMAEGIRTKNTPKIQPTPIEIPVKVSPTKTLAENPSPTEEDFFKTVMRGLFEVNKKAAAKGTNEHNTYHVLSDNEDKDDDNDDNVNDNDNGDATDS